MNCRQVLTSDVTRLKELQKKLLLEQENNMQLISKKCLRLLSAWNLKSSSTPCAIERFDRRRSYQVVTDRKLILYPCDGRRLREIPWSEVVKVGIPQAKRVPYPIDWRGRYYDLYFLPVQTLKANLEIKFLDVKHGIFERNIQGDWEGCLNIYRTVKAALNDYNTQRKNIKAIICSLKCFGEEQAAS